jgi:hypothetical protein
MPCHASRTDEEPARIVSGADHAERADLQSLVVVKLFDKASP